MYSHHPRNRAALIVEVRFSRSSTHYESVENYLDNRIRETRCRD